MKDVAKIVAAVGLFAVWATLVFGVPVAICWTIVHFVRKWW